MKLVQRKATLHDLHTIITLLREDELGEQREALTSEASQRYHDAFELIDRDPNQYLMIVKTELEVVGTCHLTLMPSLTFQGRTRLQIEAIRIKASHRSQGIGEWMMKAAIAYGQEHGATLFQLMTNKQRDKAIKFYKNMGFEPTHEGMKLMT